MWYKWSPCPSFSFDARPFNFKALAQISDESVVLQWSENAYYQYFCGQLEFLPKEPCEASDLVHFRNRIGEQGMEIILSESIRVNTENDDEDHFNTAFIDSTVQEKNVTYPTDAKLHKKIIKRVLKIVREKKLELFFKVLSQKRNSRDKIYSLHEPEVQCISKGKEHKKYEFGNKASFIRSFSGIILAAVSFRKET